MIPYLANIELDELLC